MNPWQDRRILVIGATGFAGGALARALCGRGGRVRALVRPTADTGPLRQLNVELVQGDITSAGDVDRAAVGVDLIYNFASPFRTAGKPDQYYWDVNVAGVEHVLAAARRHDVSRVVHCSTIGVHGDVCEIPCHERSPFNPGDIYQRTKLEGERLVHRAIETGQPAVVIRPSSMYGPGDLRMLKLFRSIQRGSFRMFGPGDAPFHPIHIDDVVEGFALCGVHPEAAGKVYLIAGPQHVTLNQMVAMIADAVGAPRPRGHLPIGPLMLAARLCERVCRPLGIEPPLYERRVRFFVNKRAFSAQRIRGELGFVPRIELREGLAQTARWYASRGYLKPTPTGEPASEPAGATVES